jgi:hypothetical protein
VSLNSRIIQARLRQADKEKVCPTPCNTGGHKTCRRSPQAWEFCDRAAIKRTARTSGFGCTPADMCSTVEGRFHFFCHYLCEFRPPALTFASALDSRLNGTLVLSFSFEITVRGSSLAAAG